MQPDAIILHHSLTRDGSTVNWGAIRRYHKSWKCDGVAIDERQVEGMARQGMPVQRPWNDIGYHFGIEWVGNGFETLLGRMPDEEGAHCRHAGMNRRSLGICFVGNFDKHEIPGGQWAAGLLLVRALMRIYRIPSGMVFGHRDFAPNKSCPGHLFDLDRFRRELED